MSHPHKMHHDRKTNQDWKVDIERLEQSSTDRTSTPSPQLSDNLNPAAVARLIDHTLLKLDATPEQVDKLCDEARQWGFKTVCVRLNHVKQAATCLEGTGVGVTCVIGFHEGTHSTEDKVSEAKAALEAGATELDTVLNRTAFMAGLYSSIYGELKALRSLNYPRGSSNGPSAKPILKLILETSQLRSLADIKSVCHIAACAGCDFVKTSTGFCGRGASVEDVKAMKAMCDAEADFGTIEHGGMQVKASGGIRTYEDAKKMLRVGAGRLGVSAGVEIVRGAMEAQNGVDTAAGGSRNRETDSTRDGY